jgi:ATP-dependent Clp protease ATP-binding subunit ClpC
MPYQALPRGPVHFVRDAVESLRNLQAADRRSLTREVVLQLFSAATGLPQWLIRDDEVLDQQNMRQRFEQQVRGQPLACQAACETINRFKAGMNDPQRPLRVMFFSGPTGVGKTQLAKSLGSVLLSEREEKHQLIRLDMSEYAGFGAAERLLLDDQGEPSSWIRRVRQWPFGVLLLDEIEKADLRVFDILLGLLDEGRLTDRFGRTTSFASTVIIMTSNLGTRNQNALGFGNPAEAASGHIRREMSRMFRPEFLNRIDCIVPFSPISSQIAKEIAEKELQGLARREGFLQRNLRLTWSDNLVAHLAEVGFHPQYGARPLQRSVEQLVVAEVSRWLARQGSVESLTLHLSWDGELAIRAQANHSFSAT